MSCGSWKFFGNRIFKGFRTFDFVLNDHNYSTLLYMHVNFYIQFQCVKCESVVFKTLNLLAKNLTR